MALARVLRAALQRLGLRSIARPEKPLRDELLSIERLEERAKALAARLTLDPTPRRPARDVFPRFDESARVLRKAYLDMAEDVHKGEFVTPAAEWLLDNYHLVASEVRDVRQNLPRGYYRELPKLATRELAGDARVYAMAVELIRHSDSRLDRQQLVRFMNSYQTVASLTIGELWAWPSMLKLALIENLRRLAEEAFEAREARRAADAYVAQIDAAGHGRLPPLPAAIHPAFVVQLLQRAREFGPRLSAVRAAVDAHLVAQHTASDDAIRSEHQREAAAQVSVANVITSLRLCSTLDWSQYFESVSLVERVLQRDPAGVYGSMDFLSRDRYRQAVEDLADGTGEAQLRVALRTVESARQAAESAVSDVAAHVGHHLIGKGRVDLEADVAYRPRLVRRVRRFAFAHATAAYLGSIALLTALLLGLGFSYARGHSDSAGSLAGVALLLLLPASDVAIALVQSLCARLAPPRRLPRLDYQAGVPENARTMVVVPTLLASVERATELLEHLEVLALGNLDPRVHFVLLSDFTDAPAREMPQDAAILSTVRAGVEALNARHAEGRKDQDAAADEEERDGPRSCPGGRVCVELPLATQTRREAWRGVRPTIRRRSIHHARHSVLGPDAGLLGDRVFPADLAGHALGATLARVGAAALDGLESARPAHELPLPLRADWRRVLEEGLAFEAHTELIPAHEGPDTVAMPVGGVSLDLVVVGDDVCPRLAARDLHRLRPGAHVPWLIA